jgi:Arc/MetJ-type ribon-helix-helix transcriptional regulator
MRTPLTISLPEPMIKDIRREVKAGNFASASEYIRHVYREYKLIKLAKQLKAQTKEFEQGKGIKLNSLKELR